MSLGVVLDVLWLSVMTEVTLVRAVYVRSDDVVYPCRLVAAFV
jgi:hypothetical protein